MEDASLHYERALARMPDMTSARFNLARTRFGLGNYEGVIAVLDRVAQIPGVPGAVLALRGRALMNLGRFDEALAGFARLVEEEPRECEYRPALAQCQLQCGDRAAARASAQAGLALDAGNAAAIRAMGDVQLAFAEPEPAIESFRRALHANPNDAAACQRLGEAYQMAGRFDAAERAFVRRLSLPGDGMLAYGGLATCRRFGEADRSLVEDLEQRLSNAGDVAPIAPMAPKAPMERSSGHFAAGKMREDLGDYTRAFKHYALGNRLVRERIPFDAKAHRDEVASIVRGVGRHPLACLGSRAVDSAVPIVIVGLPRSGTTLVEQILSCHAQCHGANEVVFFDALRVDKLAFPGLLDPLLADPGRGEEIARMYLARLHERAGPVLRITDKMPSNFHHLGLIATLFPNAAIVHCELEPLDLGWSIFCQNFTNAHGNAFAYDLESIGSMYQDYRHFMAHWHAVLEATRLYEVRYEELVSEPEVQIRALLQHCGLDWDPRCLRPHENQRPVLTASHWQVRQPMHQGSINRARRFAPWLGPLVSALSTPKAIGIAG